MQFKNFAEEWEFDAISNKNSAYGMLWSNKYMNMHLYDNDPEVDEIRKVVGSEWKVRAQCIPTQHVLVTQFVNKDASEDTLQPYYINQFVYDMIDAAQSPYNDGYSILKN